MYDLNRLYDFTKSKIMAFSHAHQKEIFCGFGIDNDQLCFYSLQAYEDEILAASKEWEQRHEAIKLIDFKPQELDVLTQQLAINKREMSSFPHSLEEWLFEQNQYRSSQRLRGNPFLVDQETVEEFKLNLINWDYYGFSQFSDNTGFDQKALADYIEMDEPERIKSSYHLAMESLLAELESSHVFKWLECTDDFVVTRNRWQY